MKKSYLRKVLIPNEKVRGELLEEKMDIFEGEPEDVAKDKAQWLNEKGAHSIQYFELIEYKPAEYKPEEPQKSASCPFHR